MNKEIKQGEEGELLFKGYPIRCGDCGATHAKTFVVKNQALKCKNCNHTIAWIGHIINRI